MRRARPLRQPSLWDYFLSYALWAVVVVLCYQGFWIWRRSAELFLLYVMGRSSSYYWGYLLTTLLIGLALFATVIGAEGYLRGGVAVGTGRVGDLPRRFVRLAGFLVLGIAFGIGLQEIVFRAFGL